MAPEIHRRPDGAKVGRQLEAHFDAGESMPSSAHHPPAWAVTDTTTCSNVEPESHIAPAPLAKSIEAARPSGSTPDFKEILGAPGAIRTPGPQIRSLVLYPAELRAQSKKAGCNVAGPGAQAGVGCIVLHPSLRRFGALSGCVDAPGDGAGEARGGKFAEPRQQEGARVCPLDCRGGQTEHHVAVKRGKYRTDGA